MIKSFFEYKPQNNEPLLFFYIGRIAYGVRRVIGKKMLLLEKRKRERHIHMTLEDEIDAVDSYIRKCISDREPNGRRTFLHIKTRKGGNLHSHPMRVQKNGVLAYADVDDEKDVLCVELAKYILSHRKKNGIYIAEAPMGSAQEEGPVTSGVIQAFCKVYQRTNKRRFLIEAEKAMESAEKSLYTKECGFLHTLGYLSNTTNVNASFALAYAMLFECTGKTGYRDKAERMIKEYILRNQSEEGLFFYSDERRSVYIGLYHFLVLISLLKCRDILGIDYISPVIDKGIRYGRALVREDGTVIENDNMGVYSLMQTETRAALCFLLYGDKNMAKSLIGGVAMHYLEKDFQMMMDNEKRLYDGTYLNRKESAAMDVYYDLVSISSILRRDG